MKNMKVSSRGMALAGITVLGGLLLGGCGQPNLAGVNAYNATTTPNPAQTYVMDPGSYGGIADASGGTITGTSYGTGAKGENDGDASHYDKMKAIRGSGPVDWSTPSPQTNHPLKNEFGD